MSFREAGLILAPCKYSSIAASRRPHSASTSPQIVMGFRKIGLKSQGIRIVRKRILEFAAAGKHPKHKLFSANGFSRVHANVWDHKLSLSHQSYPRLLPGEHHQGSEN